MKRIDPGTYHLDSAVRMVFATPCCQSTFFGYYDKTPVDLMRQRLLAHRVNFDGREILADDLADVGYFDFASGLWHLLGQTQAFNWQQGAMLQWLGPDYRTKIIYNVRTKDQFISVILDIETGVRKEIPFPVYAVHPNGVTAVGVNFERHYFCRAYHYQGLRNEKWACPMHPEDGLYAINLESGKVKQIVNTRTIAGFSSPGQNSDFHWLEHVFLNPSGTRMLFLHRWGAGENFRGRLFSAAIDGSEIYAFPDADIYSHAAWRSDTEFIIWILPRSPLMDTYRMAMSHYASFAPARLLVNTYRNLRRVPFLCSKAATHSRGSYMLMTDRHDVMQPLSPDQLISDGHPSFTHDQRFMLTDTYADSVGYRHLLLYDLKSKSLHELGRFLSPYNNCGYRCDLHPRFSHDEKHVIIDSAHAGRRQMLVLEIDWRKLI